MKKRNYRRFYALLRLQPEYNPQYQNLIKETIVGNFSLRFKGIKDISLNALSDYEYYKLIKEMERDAIPETNQPEKIPPTRREMISRIFKKLGEIGVNTDNGYNEVNNHIKRLKGFGGRIIPEYQTEELNTLFKAVCNYVDGYKNLNKANRKKLTY